MILLIFCMFVMFVTSCGEAEDESLVRKNVDLGPQAAGVGKNYFDGSPFTNNTGDRVVFLSGADSSGRQKVYKWSQGESAPQRLTASGENEELLASLDAQGSWVALVSWGSQGVRLNIQSFADRNIVGSVDLTSLEIEKLSIESVQFSPDGLFLAFVAKGFIDSNPSKKIAVVEVLDGQSLKLVLTAETVTAIDDVEEFQWWQPNSGWGFWVQQTSEALVKYSFSSFELRNQGVFSQDLTLQGGANFFVVSNDTLFTVIKTSESERQTYAKTPEGNSSQEDLGKVYPQHLLHRNTASMIEVIPFFPSKILGVSANTAGDLIAVLHQETYICENGPLPGQFMTILQKNTNGSFTSHLLMIAIENGSLTQISTTHDPCALVAQSTEQSLVYDLSISRFDLARSSNAGEIIFTFVSRYHRDSEIYQGSFAINSGLASGFALSEISKNRPR